MSKAKYRAAQRRRQRAKAKVLCAIDFETRCPMGFGVPDQAIEGNRAFVVGHYHVGDTHAAQENPQLMAYARFAGLDEFVVYFSGGDQLHEIEPHVPGDPGYDLTNAMKLLAAELRAYTDQRVARDPLTEAVKHDSDDR